MINTKAFKERYSDFYKEIVLDILDMFITGYNENISKLSAHLSNKDLTSLKKAAHAFKGIIGNVETNCSAFTEIERIESMSEQLSQFGTMDHIEDDEDFKKALSEIAAQFALFKNSSKQLLEEAKNLRLEYQE
jgi:hypothetical protein